MYEVILKTGVGVRGFTDAQYDTTGLKKRLKRREEKKMGKQEGCFLSFICIVYIVYNKLFPHPFFFCISMTSVLTYVNSLFI